MMENHRFKLFKHLSDQHNLILLDSEMDEIVNIALSIQDNKKNQNCSDILKNEKKIRQSFKHMKAEDLLKHYTERDSELKETQQKIDANRSELIRLRKIELNQYERLQTVKHWINSRCYKTNANHPKTK